MVSCARLHTQAAMTDSAPERPRKKDSYEGREKVASPREKPNIRLKHLHHSSIHSDAFIVPYERTVGVTIRRNPCA